jgi:hypothetical protein
MAIAATTLEVTVHQAGAELLQRLRVPRRQALQVKGLGLQRSQFGVFSQFLPQLSIVGDFPEMKAEDNLSIVRRVKHRRMRGVQAFAAAESRHTVRTPPSWLGRCRLPIRRRLQQ